MHVPVHRKCLSANYKKIQGTHLNIFTISLKGVFSTWTAWLNSSTDQYQSLEA